MEITTVKIEDLRYPLGEFDQGLEVTPELRRDFC